VTPGDARTSDSYRNMDRASGTKEQRCGNRCSPTAVCQCDRLGLTDQSRRMLRCAQGRAGIAALTDMDAAWIAAHLSMRAMTSTAGLNYG